MVDVATAPARIAGKAVDLATTSQSEADEKRGRTLRERKERIARLERRLAGESRNCERDDDAACRNRDDIRRDLDQLMRATP